MNVMGKKNTERLRVREAKELARCQKQLLKNII